MPELKEISYPVIPWKPCPLEYNEVSFDKLREWMKKVEEEHKMATKIYLNVDAGFHDIDFTLRGERLETEEEAKERLERNRKARESAKRAAETRRKNEEERERKLLEKLKKKYEED